MGRAELRDQGLRRVSSLTRWIAAGAVAGAGVLSLATARLLPGAKAHTAVSTNPATLAPATSATVDPTMPDPGTAQNTDPTLTDPTLSPPVAPPHRTRLPTRVVSGAS
jgi:hypothetical protein